MRGRAIDRQLVVTDDRFAIWRGRWLGADWYPADRPLDCDQCGEPCRLLHQRASGRVVAAHVECEERRARTVLAADRGPVPLPPIEEPGS